MRQRRKAVDFAAYLGVRLCAMVLSMFPVEANRRLLCRLGTIWFDLPPRLPPARVPAGLSALPLLGRPLTKLAASLDKVRNRFCEHRRRAEQHIRSSFPDFDEDRVAAVALASMQHIAMWSVELLRTPELVNRSTWARYVRLDRLEDPIRILLSRKGCIMLTGHYGNWELLGYALATLGFDIVAVMRPLDNEYLNRYLLDRREVGGLKLLYKKGATRTAGEVLESGGALCFIADQNAGSKGLFVDFFGRKASTYKSIGLLAMQHGVPVVVGCARRVSPKFQYEIRVNRIIEPGEWSDRPDPLEWITQEYTRALEDLVREAPEQYLWIHRRWKSRPKAELAAAAATA